jgi:hypothetical protein
VPRTASAAISPVLVLVLVLIGGLACRSPEPGPSDQPQPGPDTAPARAAASEPQPNPQPPDPERANQLRDLDDLCKSVDHDYADGTLGDYYSGLKLRTTWGESKREAGLESIKPGRALEQAAAELSAPPGDPALEHCTKLFDYLDDVE